VIVSVRATLHTLSYKRFYLVKRWFFVERVIFWSIVVEKLLTGTQKAFTENKNSDS
jgi:hypothetical protein